MNETEARVVDLLKDLILVRSTAANPEGLHHAIRLIRSHVEDIPGVRVENHQSGGLPSFVALPGSVEQAELMLVAHVDVVEAPPEHFYPVVEDGRLYGRGAGDMKGQIAVLTDVFRTTLLEHPDLPLGLMITTDEESGGEHGVHYLLGEKGYRCGSAIIPDSGRLNELVVVEKGIINGRLVSRGRAGHSSRPWLSDNAVHRLVRNLERLIAHFEAAAGEAREHWHATVSANVLATHNRTLNLVPDSAEAVVDIRYTEDLSPDDVLRQVASVLDDRTEFVPDIIAEPLATEPDRLFIAVTERVTGRPVRIAKEHGGSDGRYFTRVGIPVIMSRPEVGGLHSNREWIDIASMLAYHRVLEAYIGERFLQ
jgi:succinyl-diaminopimelate desuccinylase